MNKQIVDPNRFNPEVYLGNLVIAEFRRSPRGALGTRTATLRRLARIIESIGAAPVRFPPPLRGRIREEGEDVRFQKVDPTPAHSPQGGGEYHRASLEIEHLYQSAE